MRGSGGTPGGVPMFVIGFALALLGVWLFFDSVRVTTAPVGALSGGLRRVLGGGPAADTGSAGIVFLPFFLGVLILFHNAVGRFGWWLTWIGVGIIGIEVLSRIEFYISTKLTHLLLMATLFAAGSGLMIRSYRDQTPTGKD